MMVFNLLVLKVKEEDHEPRNLTASEIDEGKEADFRLEPYERTT